MDALNLAAAGGGPPVAVLFTKYVTKADLTKLTRNYPAPRVLNLLKLYPFLLS